MQKQLLTRPFRVLIQVHSAYKTHRETLRGALRYARLNGTWSCRVFEGRNDEQLLTDPDLGLFDGALVTASGLYSETLKRLNVPTIVVDPWLVDPTFFQDESRRCFSLVWCDNAAIARRNAEYLLTKQYPSFAFVNADRLEPWSKERERYFCQYLKERGKTCSVFRTDEQNLDSNFARLCQWLCELPKPVGVMTATDAVGRQAIDACRELGIKSPYEAGIIGVDNDPLLCESTFPSLTSIENEIDETIFQASEHLDRQMKGEIYEGRVFYYQPKRIVERGSTKAEATDDELVLRTLELIKLNVARPFGIEELAQKLDVSRRTLETRFRSRLGRTVLNVVHEIRMERACALLLETNYSIAEIAKKCGFRDGNYLATVFRQRFDVSPSQFRKIKRKRPF